MALVVANHEGGPGLERLRYAERDAGRLVDVLTGIGGFQTADILWKVDAESGDVMTALDDVERRTLEAPALDLEVDFELSDAVQYRFLNGLDDIGITMQADDDIAAFESARPGFKPVTR